MNVAFYIDHTILKPAATSGDIENVCNEAITYGFAAVCIPPYYVENAVQLVQNSNVKVATVVGFPFGYQHYSAKIAEVKQAVKGKVNEVDMVMNIAAFKDQNFDYLKEEIGAVVEVTKGNGLVLKVIIESGILSDKEIVACCNLYQQFSIDFLKTSTGYAEKGASIETVRLMKERLPGHIKIKASGGIKTLEFARDLINAGASRLGCSASVAIVNDEKSTGSTY